MCSTCRGATANQNLRSGCDPVDKNGEGISESTNLARCRVNAENDDESSDAPNRNTSILYQLNALLLTVTESKPLCAPTELLSVEVSAGDSEGSESSDD